MTCRSMLYAALMLLASLGAHAADAPETGACRTDARALCAQVQPGGGRIVTCLKSHESQLSEACRTALPVMERCAGEIRSLCGEAAGPRAMRSCLRENAAKLSPECRATAAARR